MFVVTDKEKRLRRYMLLFSITFLFIAFQCSGQVSSSPMKFSCGKLDTIYIYVHLDSLNNSELYVQCSKHQHKTWIGITIGFVDGSMMELKSKDCYSIKNANKLYSTQFDYISFDELLSSTACINIKSKDYFIRFFNDRNLK